MGKDTSSKQLIAADPFAPIVEEKWECAACGETNIELRDGDTSLCRTCSLAHKQATALDKNTNAGWKELAVDLGLALYERQPEETETEWHIWQTYRSYYPLKMPTYSELASKTGCAVATVVKAAQRWSYKVRLIDWARATDSQMQEERIIAIKEMNRKQLDMAKTLQAKIAEAIEYVDPVTLKPNELANLFKMSTELERRIVTSANEVVGSTAEISSSERKELTKPSDLSTIAEILSKAGAMSTLMGNKTVGVEQTTRIIVKEGDCDSD